MGITAQTLTWLGETWAREAVTSGAQVEGRGGGADWDVGTSSRRPPDTVETHMAREQDISSSEQSPLWDTTG